MEEIYIHPTAEVSSGASIGLGTKIWNHAQVREGASIGEACIISKNVYIDAGVVIGNHVKIQNNVNVYHGVEIEDNVFLGPSMTFTNDRFPRAFISDFEVGRTLIKRGASIGANVTIRCDITIGEYAMVGSGSVVTHDVPAYALVVGNPARQIGWVCKNGHRTQDLSHCEICDIQQLHIKHYHELESNRILLRPLTLEDAAEMNLYLPQQELLRFLPEQVCRSLSEPEDLLRSIIAGYRSHREFIWGISEKDSGRLIGTCYLTNISLADLRGEVSCLVYPAFQSRGIATETIQALIRYAFAELGLIRIQAYCTAGNDASEHLAVNCGMQFEGTLHKYVQIHGQLRDYKIYAAIRGRET